MQEGGRDANAGHHSTHRSRHSTRPPRKQEGDVNTYTGGSPSQHPPFNTMPPHLVMPPHHPRQPPPPPRRGGGGQRIPHHTNTHHHTPPHTTHPTGNSTHTTAVLISTAPGWAGRGPDYTHWADQQQHTPPPFHRTHTRRDGHHPLIHSHSFTFTQPTINHDQRDQRSSFND